MHVHKIGANILARDLAGLVSEVLIRKKEMEVLTKLKNIVILDCDADTLYKKVRVCAYLQCFYIFFYLFLLFVFSRLIFFALFLYL